MEGGGSREQDEWEGVEDRGMSFERERTIGMLTCHEKMISTWYQFHSLFLFPTTKDTINRPGHKKYGPRAKMTTWVGPHTNFPRRITLTLRYGIDSFG